jgi:hypothetical protein
LVSADAIEASLQFAGISPANLFAIGAHPIAELGRTKRRRVDVEPLLHQTFDLIARIDLISNRLSPLAEDSESSPVWHEDDAERAVAVSELERIVMAV